MTEQMHPLDVLQSRIENLAKIRDKQTEEGVDQALLAIDVAKSYIKAVAKEPDGERLTLKAVEYIFSVGTSSAGRKVSREFDIEFLSCIPIESVTNKEFRLQRWPQIVVELSK